MYQFFYEDFIEGTNKSEFKDLLFLAPPELFFIFDDVLYKQKDGLAMGLPLEPTMTIVLLSFYELKWLEQCLSDLKPVFCRRYVDDVFVSFESMDHPSKFHAYLNKCRRNVFSI